MNRMDIHGFAQHLVDALQSRINAGRRRKSSLHERPIHDVIVYDIQPSAYVAVYWKSLPNGRGPGASLYVYDEEVLRLDCFGEGAGHYHANLNTRGWQGTGDENRLFFREQTVPEQIERAAFELIRNAGYYLKRNHDLRVRHVTLNPQRLAEVADQMKAKMREYAQTLNASGFSAP